MREVVLFAVRKGIHISLLPKPMPHSLFSRRVQDAFSAPNAWSEACSALRRANLSAWDMTVTNPTKAGLECDWDMTARTLRNAPLDTYVPHGLGDVSARQAIVAHLRERTTAHEHGYFDAGRNDAYDVARLMLTTSTSESYAYLFKLLCEPGDCVMVPEPSYPLLSHLATMESLRIVTYKLGYDGAWFVDWDSVKEGLKARPKAIVVVTPNNPTASCCSVEEYRHLRDTGVPLIVDQVFTPYTRVGVSASLPFEEEEGLTFVLDGLSKRCALPHLKLGWLAAFGRKKSTDAAMQALELIGDTYLGVGALVQSAAGQLLEDTRGVRSTIRARLANNYAQLCAAEQNGAPLSVLHYQGGWSAMFRLPSYYSDEQWAERLLERGVITHPGWLYDCSLAATMVVSLLTSEDAFREGMQRIIASIE